MEAMNGTESSGRGDGWVEVLARMGYAVKGLVYLAVGILSGWAALGSGGSGDGRASGDVQGSREAIATLGSLAEDPFAGVLLALIAAGLAGYVVWRIVQTFLDPDEEGTDAKGLAKRGVLLVSAVIYAGLGLWVVRSLMSGGGTGTAGGGAGGRAGSWSRELLSHPGGGWVIAAAGLLVCGYGIAELVKAYRRGYERRLRRDLAGTERRWAGRSARVGLTARGVVFLLIGGFLVYTGVTADPEEARGLEGALRTVGRQPYGPWLLAVVAAGLASYGAFQMVKAWHRRIGPVDPV